MISCVSRNIPDITSLQILNPHGVPVRMILGVFSVPNVTRAYAGTYTCVVTSTLDNSAVNETSEVIIECKKYNYNTMHGYVCALLLQT